MSEDRRAHVETFARKTIAEVIGLPVECIGDNAHFLDLGLDSMSLARIAARLNDSFANDLSIHRLLTLGTLDALTTHLTLSAAAAESDDSPNALRDGRGIPLADRQSPLQLSFAQQRLWFLAQLGDDASRAYHSVIALRLRGALDRQALRAALDRIVLRHENLRTRFVTIGGAARQQIDPPSVGFMLRESALDGEEVEKQLQNLIHMESRGVFDLAAGPLVRGQLLRVGEREHVLLMGMHHIVTDGWSMGVFFRELGVLYASYLEGKDDPLPPLRIQYVDYALWQREQLEGMRLQQQCQYWCSVLGDAPQLIALPADRARPAVQDYAGEVVEVEIDEQLTAALKRLSQRHELTMFMTVLAGWAALLSRLSGQEDVVIGAPFANRTVPEAEELVGFLVNTLAIRVDLSGGPSTKELLARVRARVLEAQANQDVPFEQLTEMLKPERTLAHSPIFQVMLAWQNQPDEARQLQGLTVERINCPKDTAQFDLSLSVREHSRRILGSLTYATALYERRTVERYLGYWKKLLEGMAADEESPIDSLEWLSDAERELVLVEWNRAPSLPDTKR
jgi:acyl carrier protein